MSSFKLCSDDILVNTLHKVFRANIVRTPEALIKPLSVLAVTSQKPHFWGSLIELLEDPIPNAHSAIQESQMADISGKHSKSISLALGLQILEGFLRGFQLPSAAISSKFVGARSVSFSFQDVVRFYISPTQLGSLLQGNTLNAAHASNNIFFQKEARLFVIDSIITSKDFSINVDKSDTNDFSLDVPAIRRIIGQVNTDVQVKTNTGLDISFQGKTSLTFAFTCLECVFDAAGRISLKPTSTTTHFEINQLLDHKQFSDAPSMLEFY